MSGSSGVTNITVSATSTTELVDLVESYTLANDSKEIGMALVQKAYAPLEKYIIFQPNSMSVESSGGTSSINIQSNDAWEIVSDDWIQLSRYESESKGGYNSLNGDGNTIVGLRFSENTGSSRNGGISGYCKSNSAISATTTIQQSGSYVKPYLTLGQYQYNIESSGQSGCSLAVVSNLDWTVSTDARWITINTASGSSDGTISFSVQENSQNIGRRATITVTSTTESVFAECTINQSASAVSVPYIIISPTDQTIPLSGGSFTISVSSNTDWDVAVIVSEGGLSRPWISVDKLNGSGDDDVVVTVNAVGGSSEIASRSAYIGFYNNKEGLKTECNIEQIAPNTRKLYYTSVSGNVVNPKYATGWGASIISNTYVDGQGVIEFDGDVISVPDNAFGGSGSYTQPSLVSVILPDSVETIGNNAFATGMLAAKHLKSVYLGTSLKVIGSGAFTYAVIDSGLTIPNTVTEIKANAFRYAISDGDLVIGENVQTIGYRAFEGCGFSNIYAYTDDCSIGTEAFYINNTLQDESEIHYVNGSNVGQLIKNQVNDPSDWILIGDL